MKKHHVIKRDGFFTRLLKEDTNVSAMNFFLIATLVVGVILLFIPAVGLIVDICFNHTITINLSDLALYIGAVVGIFTAGGLSSAWTEFAYSKYNVPSITEVDMAENTLKANEIYSTLDPSLTSEIEDDDIEENMK